MDKSRELLPITSLGGQRLQALSVLSIFRYQTLNVYYPSLISNSTLYIFHFRSNVERYKIQVSFQEPNFPYQHQKSNPIACYHAFSHIYFHHSCDPSLLHPSHRLISIPMESSIMDRNTPVASRRSSSSSPRNVHHTQHGHYDQHEHHL